jgi:hypothetical protein
MHGGLLDQGKIGLHDGVLIDGRRLDGVQIHVDLPIQVLDVHDGILIGIDLLPDHDIHIDDIALLQARPLCRHRC